MNFEFFYYRVFCPFCVVVAFIAISYAAAILAAPLAV